MTVFFNRLMRQKWAPGGWWTISYFDAFYSKNKVGWLENKLEKK